MSDHSAMPMLSASGSEASTAPVLSRAGRAGPRRRGTPAARLRPGRTGARQRPRSCDNATSLPAAGQAARAPAPPAERMPRPRSPRRSNRTRRPRGPRTGLSPRPRGGQPDREQRRGRQGRPGRVLQGGGPAEEQERGGAEHAGREDGRSDRSAPSTSSTVAPSMYVPSPKPKMRPVTRACATRPAIARASVTPATLTVMPANSSRVPRPEPAGPSRA